MASINKRGDFWRAQIRRKGYEPISQTFDTKQEAAAWARSIEGKMDRGVFVSRKEVEATTLREAIERYQREVTPLKKGAAQEVAHFKIILRDPLCDMILAEIQGKHIAGFRDRRLVDVSPSTVTRELNILGHVFTVVIKDWSMPLPANPVQLIRRPKVPANAARNRRLQKGEEERLLAASRDYGGQWLQAVVELALETAMRRGELFNLRWPEVDLKHRFVHLPQTKNESSRDVPLSSRAVRILNNLPRSLDGRVFKFKSPEQISVKFHRACQKAKNSQGESEPIEDLRFHDLRHEATSRIAEKVPDVHTLAKITGHKTLQMLSRYYHPRPEDLAKMLG